MSRIETLFKNIWRKVIWGMLLDYFAICPIALTRQKYLQNICICSTILSLCQKDKQPPGYRYCCIGGKPDKKCKWFRSFVENKFNKQTDLNMSLSALFHQSKFCVENVAGVLFIVTSFHWYWQCGLMIYVLVHLEKVGITGIFEIIYSF